MPAQPMGVRTASAAPATFDPYANPEALRQHARTMNNKSAAGSFCRNSSAGEYEPPPHGPAPQRRPAIPRRRPQEKRQEPNRGRLSTRFRRCLGSMAD